MAARAQYRIEHVAAAPRGWKVRSKRSGSHVLRFAAPPGRRKKGAAKIVEVLHPKGEKNPSCIVSHRARKNPETLLIFNPSTLGKKRATRERAARIRAARLNRSKVSVTFDDSVKKFLATTYHPKYGNLFATGKSKSAARSALRQRVKVAEQTGTHRNPQEWPAKCPHCEKKFSPAQVEAGEFRRHLADHRAKRQRRRRRNPISETEQAVSLFQTFTGRDPHQISEKHVSAAMRKDYTALGKLISVICDDMGYGEKEIAQHWDRCDRIDFDDTTVTLASSPDGRQLYAIGGNQNITDCLKKFEGVDPTKDFIDLGEVAAVVYEARKIHDSFQPVQYVHKFGGAGHTSPRWFFDRLKKQIFFIGGEYFIDISAKISPGIEG